MFFSIHVHLYSYRCMVDRKMELIWTVVWPIKDAEMRGNGRKQNKTKQGSDYYND